MMDIRCQRRLEPHYNILELGQHTCGPGTGDGGHVVPGQQLLGLGRDVAGVRRVVVDVPAEGGRRDRDRRHARRRERVARVVGGRHAQDAGTKGRQIWEIYINKTRMEIFGSLVVLSGWCVAIIVSSLELERSS